MRTFLESVDILVKVRLELGLGSGQRSGGQLGRLGSRAGESIMFIKRPLEPFKLPLTLVTISFIPAA